jgi:uncharacterized protein (TIGR02452 family)
MNRLQDRKTKLINVWTNTKDKCNNGHYGENVQNGSVVNSVKFLANDNKFNDLEIKPKFDATNVSVVNQDTLITAKTLYDQLQNDPNNSNKKQIMVLNMASWKHPGGGVENGAMAQEEELFRRSNYFLTLLNGFYPFKRTESVYSANVYVVKNEAYLDLPSPFPVSMLAMPAISKPQLDKNNKYSTKDYATTCQVIENIFKVALLMESEILVLGAIGCGAYRNPPEEVVKIFNLMLTKYDKCFKTIVFSVLSRHDNNFNVFNKNIVRLN